MGSVAASPAPPTLAAPKLLSPPQAPSPLRPPPAPPPRAGGAGAPAPTFGSGGKPQGGSAVRPLVEPPEERAAWGPEPLGNFGERLGAVLFRIPAEIRRGGPIFGGDARASDE